MEKSIGSAITKIRESKEMDAAGFGRLIFLEKNEVEKIENGVMVPTPDTLEMISNIFSVSVDDLREGEIKSIPTREALMKSISEIQKELQLIRNDNQYLIGILKRVGLDKLVERHVVKEIEEKEVYVVVDTQTGEIMIDEDAEELTWENATDAQAYADILNSPSSVQPEPEEKVPYRNSVQKDIGSRRIK